MAAAVRANAAQANKVATGTAAQEQQAREIAGANPRIAPKMDFSAFGS